MSNGRELARRKDFVGRILRGRRDRLARVVVGMESDGEGGYGSRSVETDMSLDADFDEESLGAAEEYLEGDAAIAEISSPAEAEEDDAILAD